MRACLVCEQVITLKVSDRLHDGLQVLFTRRVVHWSLYNILPVMQNGLFHSPNLAKFCAPCHTSFGILNIGDLHSLRLVIGRDLSDPGDGLHLHPAPVPLNAVDDAGQHRLHALLLGGGGEHGLAGDGHGPGVLQHRVLGLLRAVPLDDLLPVAADQLILKTTVTSKNKT